MSFSWLQVIVTIQTTPAWLETKYEENITIICTKSELYVYTVYQVCAVYVYSVASLYCKRVQSTESVLYIVPKIAGCAYSVGTKLCCTGVQYNVCAVCV